MRKVIWFGHILNRFSRFSWDIWRSTSQNCDWSVMSLRLDACYRSGGTLFVVRALLSWFRVHSAHVVHVVLNMNLCWRFLIYIFLISWSFRKFNLFWQVLFTIFPNWYLFWLNRAIRLIYDAVFFLKERIDALKIWFMSLKLIMRVASFILFLIFSLGHWHSIFHHSRIRNQINRSRKFWDFSRTSNFRFIAYAICNFKWQ